MRDAAKIKQNGAQFIMPRYITVTNINPVVRPNTKRQKARTILRQYQVSLTMLQKAKQRRRLNILKGSLINFVAFLVA